jgi:hypothetical protein
MRSHPTIALVVSTPRTTLHTLSARLSTPRAHIINHLLVRHITILGTTTSSAARGTTRFLIRGERVSVIGGCGSGFVRGQVDHGGNDRRRLRGFFSL